MITTIFGCATNDESLVSIVLQYDNCQADIKEDEVMKDVLKGERGRR